MSKTKEELTKKLIEEFGVNKNHLSIKTLEELDTLYLKLSREKIEHYKSEVEKILNSGFNQNLSDTEEIKEAEKYWRQISNNIKNPKKLYEIFEHMVRNIEIEIINEMIDNHTNEQTYNVIYRKIRVKYRQYQEELLAEIISHYSILPEEERYNQIAKLNTIKEDLKKLKHILNSFKNPTTNESIKKLASIKKTILKNYFPDAHDTEYKEYVENKVVKKQLIDKILDLKAGYTREDLFSKSGEDLRNIRDFLVEEHNKKVKEQRLMNKYIKGFEDQYYIKDDTSLSLFAKEGRKELSYEQMKEIVETLKNFDSIFGEKVNLLLIGHP